MQGRSQRPDDHDDRDQGVDGLASDHVGDPPEDQGAKEGGQDGRSRHPTRLGRRQVPLGLDQRGHGRNDEEVVGVGEEAHPRDEHGSTVELAGRRLVQETGNRGTRGREACLRQQIPDTSAPEPAPVSSSHGAPLRSRCGPAISQASVTKRQTSGNPQVNKLRTFGKLPPMTCLHSFLVRMKPKSQAARRRWASTAKERLTPVTEAVTHLRKVFEMEPDTPPETATAIAPELITACGSLVGWLRSSHAPRGFGKAEGELGAAAGLPERRNRLQKPG